MSNFNWTKNGTGAELTHSTTVIYKDAELNIVIVNRAESGRYRMLVNGEKVGADATVKVLKARAEAWFTEVAPEASEAETVPVTVEPVVVAEPIAEVVPVMTETAEVREAAAALFENVPEVAPEVLASVPVETDAELFAAVVPVETVPEPVVDVPVVVEVPPVAEPAAEAVAVPVVLAESVIIPEPEGTPEPEFKDGNKPDWKKLRAVVWGRLTESDGKFFVVATKFWERRSLNAHIKAGYVASVGKTQEDGTFWVEVTAEGKEWFDKTQYGQVRSSTNTSDKSEVTAESAA